MTSTRNNNNSNISSNNDLDMDMGLCMMVWKKRSGLGQFLSYKHPYEQRWAVLMGTTFEYFDTNNIEKPRGSIDIVKQHVVVRVVVNEEEVAPTTHGLDLEFDTTASTDDENNTMNNNHINHPPSNNNANANANANNKRNKWRLCFETQEYQIQFLEFVHKVLDTHGQFKTLDKERFEHDFQPADHIFRWEMIVMPPIIYPIQIHGIVLEAGRNCVILADFGLTGYGRREGSDFNFADDHHSQMIQAAWKKLRPANSDQRLNITTLTDPYEIRKWTKVNYGKNFMFKGVTKNVKSPALPTSQTFEKFTSLFRTRSLGEEIVANTPPSSDRELLSNNSEQVPNKGKIKRHSNPTSNSSSIMRVETNDSSSSSKQQSQQTQHDNNTSVDELPKSDPKKIVLARTHFLLDGNANSLPPYHVFYSNSECIAVWCKTGRWSTLQTAVFLSSQSICAAKSSTLATLGVAAAHAVLAPVVAVGGLIYVTAPMMILKKSREKWEEATTKMTKLFWDWAPNEVYVEAIEHWSGLRDHHAVDL